MGRLCSTPERSRKIHTKFGHRAWEPYRWWEHTSKTNNAINEIGHEDAEWIHLARNVISYWHLWMWVRIFGFHQRCEFVVKDYTETVSVSLKRDQNNPLSSHYIYAVTDCSSFHLIATLWRIKMHLVMEDVWRSMQTSSSTYFSGIDP
jgi:hypothetical protein